jgi:hypothetical protein
MKDILDFYFNAVMEFEQEGIKLSPWEQLSDAERIAWGRFYRSCRRSLLAGVAR